MPIKHTKEDDEESKKVGVLSLVRALTKFLDRIFLGAYSESGCLVWQDMGGIFLCDCHCNTRILKYVWHSGHQDMSFIRLL